MNSQYLVSSNGKVVYSDVKGFMKKKRDATTVYRSITTTTNQTIRISGEHQIYSRKNSLENFQRV